MTPPWHILPLEFWSRVISRTETAREAAELRLVCKTWNPIAEKVMFSQQLHFKRLVKLKKFYSHLAKRPFLGRWIRYLDIGKSDMMSLQFQRHFLELAFTSNIEHVDGLLGNEFYKFMLDIARRSPVKFSKLKSLAHPVHYNITYVTTLLYFKDSLQELKVLVLETHKAAQIVLNRLHEFHSLTTLSFMFYDDITQLTQLEKILQKCPPQVKTLKLKLGSCRNEDQLQRDDLEQWLKENVTKSTSVWALHVDGNAHPTMMEYLLYKFPDITRASLYGYDLKFEGGVVKRILDTIKSLNCASILGWRINTTQDMAIFIPTMNSKISRVIIKERNLPLVTGGRFSATRNISKGISNFDIAIPSKQYLLHIISLISGVSYLDISFLPKKSSSERTADRETFYIEKPFSDITFTLERLIDVKIVGAVIDEGALQNLSRIAPNLKHLSLDTCLLDTTSCQDHHIAMPATDFCSLSIYARKFTAEQLEMNYSSTMKDLLWVSKATELDDWQLMFLEVTTLADNQDRYFVLRPGEVSLCKQISKKDLKRNMSEWPKMSITCSSLKHLNIDLGQLEIEIDLQEKYRSVVEIGEWKVDKKSPILPLMSD
ncbi:unnamed protein product [Mucor circinelloides]